jgi:hypothetical protein
LKTAILYLGFFSNWDDKGIKIVCRTLEIYF